jgi:alpha-tubulin suppressor-like RCC1 family protein
MTFLRRRDGRVSFWGTAKGHSLTLDNQVAHHKAVDVPGLKGVTDLASSGMHACARFPDSKIRCWGQNLGGIGDDTKRNRSNPVELYEFESDKVAQILVATDDHESCFLMRDGQRICSHSGTDKNGLHGWRPVLLKSALRFQIGSGGCGILADLRVACTGMPGTFDPGYGYWVDANHKDALVEAALNQARKASGVPLPNVQNAIAISASGTHACAIDNEGALWCWGNGSVGTFGDGKDSVKSLNDSLAQSYLASHHT